MIMPRIVRLVVVAGLGLGAVAVSTAVSSGTTPGVDVAPDALPAATCVDDIESWFDGGTITKDGATVPPDSTTFPADNTACTFYQWSWQMFLWITSPAADADGFVFDSSTFFDVSPESANGQRELIRNGGDRAVNSFALRSMKPEEIGETGQAGGSGVLIAQTGSITYYGIHVNDVYATFLTEQKGGKLKTDAFPTTAKDLAAIEKLAGMKFADGKALALELKTSWINASGVDSSTYVTITAEVPHYNKVSNTTWKVDGTETLKLALVGMHIVGSAQGHPEMIWASFEHVGNAPDAAYYYDDADGNAQFVPYDARGDWVFMASGTPEANDNIERAHVDSKTGNIVAATGQTIGPSNTYRENPWGSASKVASSAGNNTSVMSINRSIVSQLAAGDVRSNYELIGAIWTQHGNIPDGSDSGYVEKGSLDLANATMESYHQNINCFVCHSAATSLGLSHIYDDIVPLKSY